MNRLINYYKNNPDELKKLEHSNKITNRLMIATATILTTIISLGIYTGIKNYPEIKAEKIEQKKLRNNAKEIKEIYSNPINIAKDMGQLEYYKENKNKTVHFKYSRDEKIYRLYGAEVNDWPPATFYFNELKIEPEKIDSLLEAKLK